MRALLKVRVTTPLVNVRVVDAKVLLGAADRVKEGPEIADTVVPVVMLVPLTFMPTTMAELEAARVTVVPEEVVVVAVTATEEVTVVPGGMPTGPMA